MNTDHRNKPDDRARQCAAELMSVTDPSRGLFGSVITPIIQRHIDVATAELKDYYESPECPITEQAWQNGFEAGKHELKSALEKAQETKAALKGEG